MAKNSFTGAEKKPFGQEVIARVTGALKVLSGTSVWFGPMDPIQSNVPAEQQESVRGRQFDFPVGYNMRMRPRNEEAVSFGQMRALADSCDLLRLVIETRKDQLAKMTFKVQPRKDGAETDARCDAIHAFFMQPDGFNNWQDWLRMLVEEMLVTDAATVYPWLTNGGQPYRFELMDGATIKRNLDARGRTPAPPLPAYQQILKGVVACDYTSDELVYAPRNKRVHKVYGYSPVEQVVATVNIAIRRALHQLQYYTEGSAADLIFQVPPEWNMGQIKEFNDWWTDSLSGNTANRRKAQFVPNGVTPFNTKDALLKDEYDEWLAKIICYAFSVSSQALSKQMNRATAETAHQQALQEGLQPLLQWVKGVVDLLIAKYFKAPDLEFRWNEEEEVDSNTQSQIDDRNLKNGSVQVNEVRKTRGLPPLEIEDKPMVLLGTGYVPLEPEETPEPGTVDPHTGMVVPVPGATAMTADAKQAQQDHALSLAQANGPPTKGVNPAGGAPKGAPQGEGKGEGKKSPKA